MILPLTMKWQSLAMSPEYAELLESRWFTTEEICRLYQVLPQIVQDHSRSTFPIPRRQAVGLRSSVYCRG